MNKKKEIDYNYLFCQKQKKKKNYYESWKYINFLVLSVKYYLLYLVLYMKKEDMDYIIIIDFSIYILVN